MIIKLVKPGGVSQLIDCDDVMVQPTALHTMDVEIFKNGTRAKRVIVGDRSEETAEWETAYVMENGKTVDTIRQTTFSPKKTKPDSNGSWERAYRTMTGTEKAKVL